jgi:putative DNA primase/helicase
MTDDMEQEAFLDVADGDVPPATPAADPAIPRGFYMTRSGVFRRPDDPAKPDVFVCAPLHVTAQTRDGDGSNWGVLLEWLDREGRAHQWPMPHTMLAGEGTALRAALLNRGLLIGTSKSAREKLGEYLMRATPPELVRVVPRIGWHGAAGARVFVLPDGALGAGQGSRIMLQTDRPDALPPLVASGSLDEWREAIAQPAIGNSRLAFAIAAALAPPLLELVSMEGGGFHLRGGSSVGKTTALQVAGSVWGGGGLRGWCRSWKATDNALEAVAATHSDVLLCLDEMGECAPEAVASAAYALANGAGKGRAARDGSARRIAEWRLLFLSTGEEGLAARLAEGRGGPIRARAGQEIRVLDIPAQAGPLGLFDVLPPGFASPRELADALKASAGRCYGTAGRAWLAALTADPERYSAAAREVMEAFTRARVPASADGQVQRAARRFGLVAAAGELAASAGVLPWEAGEAERAAAVCFREWLAARPGGQGAAESAEAIGAVRLFLVLHGESRFQRILGANETADDNRAVINRAGWRKLADDGLRFLIQPDVFRSEVVRGMDASAAARALSEAGFLVPGEDGRWQRKERVGMDGTPRVYVVREAILTDDAPR